MMEEEKELDKNLFAPIHRVSSQDDFLHQKIVKVMGDYVESQSIISDLIYVSHQDRELLLPLFPPRRLDISYHGFGPRPKAFQPNVKVAPLQVLQPSSKSTTKTSLGPPKGKLTDANVNIHEKKQNREDWSSRELQPKAPPPSVPVAIQRSSGGSDIFSKPESQPAEKEANVKIDENVKSKQIEDPSFLPNQIDRHKTIDIGALIKEMTLPPLISPISSPKARMSVETVLKEMIINISPLSPIPNTERQDVAMFVEENQNISSSAKACNGNSNIGLHSVQDILGDISSSSDEEKDADKSAEPLAIRNISPKAVVNFNPPENIISIEKIKSEECNAPKSEGISCLEQEITEPKESKYNPIFCKDNIKTTRPILAKNLIGSLKRGRRSANKPCSKIPIAKTIQEISEKESRVTHYPKDVTDSVKRPVSSFDPFKFQRSQYKMKIAPPSASQIVSRPKNMVPISMQGKDNQQVSSNLLRVKYNKTPLNNQPKIRGSPNTQPLINLPRPKPPPPHYHQQPVSRNENGVSLSLSNLSKDIYVPNTSDYQPSIPVLNPEQNSSSSARSPKDVPIKTDTLPAEKRPAMVALTVERSLPVAKVSNDRDISNAFDSLPTESQPYAIPSPEQSLSLLSANRTVAFLKGSPYSSVKRCKSSTEHDSEWTPQKESDKKMFLKKLVVSPYKLSPSKSPKTEPSFPKFKGKRLQVKINLRLMNEYCRNRLCSHIDKQTVPLSTPFSSPLFFPNSFGDQRRKNKTTSKYKKLLIKLDTNLLASIPTQNASIHSFLCQGDAKPLAKRLCTSSLLNDSQQSSQEKTAIESDIKKLLKENSKSCYSRAKYLKDQAKIMKKEVQMFLHLLAANWFVLCSYQMEKEGCSPNSTRRHLDEMDSFLNEIGCFEDVRMECLRYLLRAVVCQKRYELSNDRLRQLQIDLNAEYKSIFGLSFFASESVFRNCLDQHQKKNGNSTLAKSVSVSYRFLQLNKEYQSLVELLAKSQEFLSKAKILMQGKYQFFSLVKSRLQNLNICLEIPLIVDFVKTCTELLQPKELGFIIAAQSR